jgi:hypothetical protein
MKKIHKKNEKNEKNENNENNVKHIHSQDVLSVVEKKIQFFQDVIKKTMLYVQKNKMLDILGVSEVTTCFQGLNEISDKIRELLSTKNLITTETLINNLQSINNDLSGIFKMYGTESLEDLLTICFGSNVHLVTDDLLFEKFNLLKKYFHPTNYSLLNVKKEEEQTIEKTMKCGDISIHSKNVHLKIYGLKLFVYNKLLNKHLIVYGLVDDVLMSVLNNRYINKRIELLTGTN